MVEAAQRLQPDYREPLLLRCVRGMSYRQIADILDLPVTTIETRLARARRMIRENRLLYPMADEHLYLVAYDHGREDWRTFKVVRIRVAQVRDEQQQAQHDVEDRQAPRDVAGPGADDDADRVGIENSFYVCGGFLIACCLVTALLIRRLPDFRN